MVDITLCALHISSTFQVITLPPFVLQQRHHGTCPWNPCTAAVAGQRPSRRRPDTHEPGSQSQPVALQAQVQPRQGVLIYKGPHIQNPRYVERSLSVQQILDTATRNTIITCTCKHSTIIMEARTGTTVLVCEELTVMTGWNAWRGLSGGSWVAV